MKIVIFCGGHGTRLWPVSRKSLPKPFIPLIGGKSFYQMAYRRYRKRFKKEDIFISTEDRYLSFVLKQTPEVSPRNIILEPERKDILAACGLATAVINKYYPGETMLVSWAKHLFSRESVFLDAVAAAGEYATQTGKIVSVDAKPEFASVHNGWVKMGKKLGKVGKFDVVAIERHVEKPKKVIAERFYHSGDWLINTGYRVWKSDTMLGYYKDHQPAMFEGLERITKNWGTDKQKEVLEREYHNFKTDSIEYGIFEKLGPNSRATIAADMGWEDVGISWETFYRGLITPSHKTVIEGGVETEFINSENNLVIGPKGKMIALIGISNSLVIDTPDGLLVAPINQSHKVKDLYKKLERYYKEYTE